MWLFIAFLAIPVIEIALFIQIGGAIGTWPTLLTVVATAIAGSYLVRSQGLATLGKLRASMDQFTDPTETLADGAMILFSGALLLTPGFFTDAVGFALLVPGIRHWLFKQARARVKVQTFGPAGNTRPARDDIVEGEFQEVDPNAPPVRGPSGWTKH
ncbi:MAG: FxsA family protein [Pseudomonadota bacterium]